MRDGRNRVCGRCPRFLCRRLPMEGRPVTQVGCLARNRRQILRWETFKLRLAGGEPLKQAGVGQTGLVNTGVGAKCGRLPESWIGKGRL